MDEVFNGSPLDESGYMESGMAGWILAFAIWAVFVLGLVQPQSISRTKVDPKLDG